MDHVTVFGLGRVGIPVAVEAARRGYTVSGVDVSQDRVASIQAGRSPWGDETTANEDLLAISATTDPATVVPEADVILVCVPTPLDSNFSTDLSNVQAVFESVAKSVTPDTLVVIESTVPPGTTERIGRGTIASEGSVDPDSIMLAHCPERIDPGNEDEWPLTSIPRVLGGLDDASTTAAWEFYEELLEAEIHRVENARTAACTKIVENAFRDVNIAFVNELARSLHDKDVDVYDVLDGAATKPYGYMKFTPGPGVGGHCIPVDPYMLINQAKRNGAEHEFLQLARRINDAMPEHVVELCQALLNRIERPVNGTRITQLGLSFKGGIGDMRSSPAMAVRRLLEDRGAFVETYDPHLPEASSLETPYADAEMLVVVTDHDEFAALDYGRLADHGVEAVFDARNALDRKAVTSTGMAYANLAGIVEPGRSGR